jgi:4-hydroxy-tetrahydrodipicolinate reductase
MNIALIGYGKMGKSVQAIAEIRGHEIVCIVDENEGKKLENLLDQKIDIAIEFTQPDSAFDNLSFCLQHGIAVISGTTGWLDKYNAIRSVCLETSGTLLHASNFSLGVNIFFKLNNWLASVLNNFPDYKISIEEIHHVQKKDKPSGTAITLAENIIKTQEAYNGWTLNDKPAKGKIKIDSIRKDDVPGTHTVLYNGTVDQIALTHIANSREGFALGAVLVAEWIKDKKGVFTMNDFIRI